MLTSAPIAPYTNTLCNSVTTGQTIKTVPTTSNISTRKWGNSSVAINPYVTGYFFINFKTREKNMRHIFDSLRCSNISIKYQDSIMKTEEDMKNKILNNKSIALQFIEFDDIRIRKSIDNLKNCKLPIDLYYWTTSPNGKDIQYCCQYKNIIVSSDDIDSNLRSSDLKCVERLIYNVNFLFDEVIDNISIREQCEKFIQIDYHRSI